MEDASRALTNIKYNLDYLNLTNYERDEDISRFYKLLQQCFDLKRGIQCKKDKFITVLSEFDQKLTEILIKMGRILQQYDKDVYFRELAIKSSDSIPEYISILYNVLYSCMGVSQYHHHVCNYDRVLEDMRDQLDIFCVKYYVCLEEDTIKLWRDVARLNAEMFTYKNSKLDVV